MANSTGEMGMADHEDRVAEFLGQLPERVRARVSTLQGLQAEHDALESRFHEEVAELERKYELLYAPFYKERAKIVSGKDDKAGGGGAVSAKEAGVGLGGGGGGGGGGAAQGIPSFWLTAMSNYRDIKVHMTEKDADALKFLEDIRWSRLDGDNPQSFKLEFIFAPNPFFTNTVLTKTYFMEEEDDDSVLARAAGTVINWKEGKNLCAATEPVKRGGGGMKSFFAFFSPPDIPDDENSLDEEEAMDLRDELEEHCELGIAIKEQLIPRAVSWYTGEAIDDEEEEDDDDDDEEDDDDGDDQ